jgi:hypothetical protein
MLLIIIAHFVLFLLSINHPILARTTFFKTHSAFFGKKKIINKSPNLLCSITILVVMVLFALVLLLISVYIIATTWMRKSLEPVNCGSPDQEASKSPLMAVEDLLPPPQPAFSA